MRSFTFQITLLSIIAHVDYFTDAQILPVSTVSKGLKDELNVLDVSSLDRLKKLQDLTVQLYAKGKKMNFTSIKKREMYYYGVDSDNECTINLIENENKTDGSISYAGMIIDEKEQISHQITSNWKMETVVNSKKLASFPEGGEAQIPEYITKQRRRKRVGDEMKVSSHYYQVMNNKNVIDIMFLYTENAECENSFLSQGCSVNANTKRNMESTINLSVEIANTAFKLSGIKTSLRLVHSYRESSYVETSTRAFNNALTALQNPNDGVMDNVHTKRKKYGADMVSMVIENGDYCGLAYVGAGDYAFSVNWWYCIGSFYTLAHELGHNFGCYHDRGSAESCNDSGYNFGYRDPQARFRDIMAYNCVSGQCDNSPGQSCPTVQQFSSRKKKYNGMSLGNKKNDCAQHINDQRINVGTYHPDPNLSCGSGKVRVRIEVQTDAYPWDITWTLKKKNTNKLVMAQEVYRYEKLYAHEECLAKGKYKFQINRPAGLCCWWGEGYYKVYVRGALVREGGEFEDFEKFTFKVK